MPPRRKKKNTFSPLYLIIAGAVLVLGTLIWVALSGRSTGTSTVNSNLPYPEIARVSLADAKAAFDQNSAIFLDVRAKDSFDARHIRGATSIPLDQLSSRMNELDKNAWIITYCT